MKFILSFSVLVVFAITAFGNIIPRDFTTLQNDVKTVNNDCLSLKTTVEQLKAPLNSALLLSLVTGSNNLSNELLTLGGDAKITGTITDAQALALLASISNSINNCIIPALNELTGKAALLAGFKAEIEAELKKLQTSYLSCASNLIAVCPSAEKPQASQLVTVPNAALATCLKAYA